MTAISHTHVLNVDIDCDVYIQSLWDTRNIATLKQNMQNLSYAIWTRRILYNMQGGVSTQYQLNLSPCSEVRPCTARGGMQAAQIADIFRTSFVYSSS